MKEIMKYEATPFIAGCYQYRRSMCHASDVEQMQQEYKEEIEELHADVDRVMGNLKRAVEIGDDAERKFEKAEREIARLRRELHIMIAKRTDEESGGIAEPDSAHTPNEKWQQRAESAEAEVKRLKAQSHRLMLEEEGAWAKAESAERKLKIAVDALNKLKYEYRHDDNLCPVRLAEATLAEIEGESEERYWREITEDADRRNADKSLVEEDGKSIREEMEEMWQEINTLKKVVRPLSDKI